MAKGKRIAERKQKPKTVNYATPALEKGLDILEILSNEPVGLTKSQVARELDRTVSEIFRMLLCLEQRGYISQVSEDRYSLTLKLFQMVQQHPPTERLIVDALPVMQRLAQETSQSCHLGILQGGRIVILAQQNAPLNLGFYVKLGSTLDLMEAASGYLILAHQDDAHRQQTLKEWNHVTGNTPPSDLDVHLRRIRKMGYEKSASYLVKGITNISFPILNHQGSAIAALTIPYIEYSNAPIKMNEVIEFLKKAASEITAALGGSPHKTA
jgi:DNA-binding IclR family transcriptional regulator